MKKMLVKAALLALAGMFIHGSASAQVFSRDLQYYRYPDQRGINVFEAPKDDMGVVFDGVSVRVGGQYALQFQGLDHDNSALPSIDPLTGINRNQLIDIGDDFNLATANLDLDIQLENGVRTHVRTYLSSRHHPEPYVKSGYLQIDSLDFVEPGLAADLMENLRIKIGHMELNYGDAHFRRSDNAEVVYNPFVGNLIMDSFSTEVGTEVYYFLQDWIFMIGFTNGKLNQYVTDTDTRSISTLGKIVWDRQMDEDLRVRLAGSLYTTDEASPVRLYAGDRAGSRYYFVTENTTASSSGNFRSGRYNPSVNLDFTAIMLNAFVQFQGLEFHGTWETVDGKPRDGASDEESDQIAGEVIYRFGENDKFYVGGRVINVDGEESGVDISIDRTQLAAGWFWTKNMLLKLEWVKQEYNDFPATNRLSGAEFDGIMLETAVAF